MKLITAISVTALAVTLSMNVAWAKTPKTDAEKDAPHMTDINSNNTKLQGYIATVKDKQQAVSNADNALKTAQNDKKTADDNLDKLYSDIDKANNDIQKECNKLIDANDKATVASICQAATDAKSAKKTYGK